LKNNILPLLLVGAIVAIGFYLSIKEMDRIERITGERPTLYDVLAP
jgi:hypothetical protein